MPDANLLMPYPLKPLSDAREPQVRTPQ